MDSEARASQLNLARDNAMVFAVQNGNMHLHQRIGTHHIDELDLAATPPTADDQPSQLLNAANRVVHFTGRERELADLTAWRDGPAAVAVRVVHGGAGQGKSRLAHQFVELSRDNGWITLRARHSRDVAQRSIEVQQGGALATRGRVLVLLDYAERWPLSDLMALLLDQRLHGGLALRVLLLARPLGNWWHALTHGLSEALGVWPDYVELTPLGATHNARLIYQVASSCFAQALGVRHPRLSSQPVEGSVLTIHMAALADVLAARHGDVPPTNPSELSAYLLVRERSHWQSMYDNDRRIESTPRVLGQAVYLAALTRPVDHTAAVRVLKATGVTSDDGIAGQVLEDHAMCYPSKDPDTVFEPLYPDRLAEDFVALATPGHAVGRFRADPWATTAFAALVTDTVRSAVTALPLVVDAARRWPHLAERQLLPLLRERPEIAVQAGAPALSAIAATPLVPLDVLEAIESTLPAEPGADLHTGIAAITERLAEELTGRAADPVGAARLSQKLGWRLLEAGQVPNGISLLSLAVDAARRLAADNAVGHRPHLELALRSLGHAHVRAADWPAATAALSEAVGLWTDTAAPAMPAAAEVAGCLSDLSLALWHEGNTGSSLRIRKQAITRLRQLVATEPRHRLTLIRTLIQQAEQLRHGESHHDSLDTLDEAITLLREVATDPHTGLESEFATTLMGRAKTLLALGRLAAAEQTATTAVKVLQRLAEVNISYDRDLAQSLLVQAEILGALRRWPDAIRTQKQAISIHQRLTRINVERHGSDLARAQIALARLCLDGNDQPDEALASLHDAIALLQAGRHDPVVQRRLLDTARALGADLLDAAGRHAEADALRRATYPTPRFANRPSSTSSSRSRTPEPRPTTAHRRQGRLMRGLAPYDARERLETLSPRDAAAVLAAAKLPDSRLDIVFRGLSPEHANAILTWLVRHDSLTVDMDTWRTVSRQLLTLAPHEAAAILHHASPETAATILNFDVWQTRATKVLQHLDHAAQIVRLLHYVPLLFLSTDG